MRWCFLAYAASAVLRSSGPAHGQTAVVAREEMRVGEAVGLDLSTVRGLAVGDQGWIFVAQPADAHVKVVDRDGRLLRVIGRRGAGPGEFQFPAAVGWLADTLWVQDMQARRISLFSPDGRFHSSFASVVDLEMFPLRPAVPAALLATGASLVVPDYTRGWWAASRLLTIHFGPYHPVECTL